VYISSIQEYVGQLSESCKAKVLDALMENEPEPLLAKKIYGLAIKLSESNGEKESDDDANDEPVISSNHIASDVRWEIYSMVDVELDRRARGLGYTAMRDVVSEMLSEILEPFMDELKKLIEKGSIESAKAYCIGIIRGLKERLEEGIFEYFTGVVEKQLSNVVQLWRSANPSEKDMEEVRVEARILAKRNWKP
jgi:hypothetical protein